jgi:hypothetical protein
MEELIALPGYVLRILLELGHLINVTELGHLLLKVHHLGQLGVLMVSLAILVPLASVLASWLPSAGRSDLPRTPLPPALFLRRFLSVSKVSARLSSCSSSPRSSSRYLLSPIRLVASLIVLRWIFVVSGPS